MRETVSGLPRAFWWLWTSTLIMRLGSFVAPFLVLYLTAERGYTASFAGVVAALFGAGGAVASLVGGVLADRVGRRATLLITQVAAAGLTAALGFASTPSLIAVFACAAGAASSASRPVVQTVMADVVSPKDRVRAFSLYYWAVNIGFGVAAASAGFLSAYGYRWLFLIEAAATLLSALVIATRLPETRTHPVDTGEGAVEERGTGFRTVLRDREFLVAVGLSFLLIMVFQQAAVGLPVAMDRSGLTPAQYGLVMSLNGILIVALQLPLGRRLERLEPGRPLVVASLLCAGGFGLNALAGGAAVYAVAVVVWTLGEIVHAPVNMGLIARLSPSAARGRYQGVHALSWATATMAAPLCAGVVIDRFGPDALWAGCTVLGCCAAVGYWTLLLRKQDRRRTPTTGHHGRRTRRTARRAHRAPSPHTQPTPRTSLSKD
ncbi:MDR family MFS transporter [Streptomyces sp. NY05-11A]|uniref:MDR family MFS transporter n=1 Tax=Streptomyces soliscabiei TaxID=588897 RepID=UPI0029B85C5B|nr:MFS transporter [Streptomyces sp. NY05-11A]